MELKTHSPVRARNDFLIELQYSFCKFYTPTPHLIFLKFDVFYIILKKRVLNIIICTYEIISSTSDTVYFLIDNTRDYRYIFFFAAVFTVNKSRLKFFIIQT